MAQSPLGNFADLSTYQRAAAQPNISPLDALIQGAQQGAAIINLPQELQNKALNDQLARAVQLAKIREMQQGSVHNVSGVGLVRINPLNGLPEVIQPSVTAAPKEVWSDALGAFINPIDHTFRYATRAGSAPSSSMPQTVEDIFPSTQPSITAPELGFNTPAPSAASTPSFSMPSTTLDTSSILTGTIAQRQAAKEANDKAAAEAKSADKIDQRNFTTEERKAHEEFLKGTIEQRGDIKAEEKKAKDEEKKKEGSKPTGEISKDFVNTNDMLTAIPRLEAKIKELRARKIGEPTTFEKAIINQAYQSPTGIIGGLETAFATGQIRPEIAELEMIRAQIESAYTTSKAGLSQTASEIKRTIPTAPTQFDSWDRMLSKSKNLNDVAKIHRTNLGKRFPSLMEESIQIEETSTPSGEADPLGLFSK